MPPRILETSSEIWPQNKNTRQYPTNQCCGLNADINEAYDMHLCLEKMLTKASRVQTFIMFAASLVYAAY